MDHHSQYFDPAPRRSTRPHTVSAQPTTRKSFLQNNDITENDFPMDDFDRALLADPGGNYDVTPRESSWSDGSPPEALRQITRSIPQGGDWYSEGPKLLASSPRNPISSPTISMLQHGRRSRERTVLWGAGEPRTPVPPHLATPADENTISPPSLQRDLTLKHAPPTVQGIQLVPVSRLPDNFRALFKFSLFNAVQSKCFDHVYNGNDNLVLSAPTGSGKTAVMELAVCRLLMNKNNEDFKVVYQAPTKSLCSERYRDWTSRFCSLGLQCAELTGDVEMANLKHAQQANVIIATPEKWDSVTRKWKDNAKLMRMIKLFLVDEVHILRESRGATLEAVVSRMKSVGSNVRFVALSATVPNPEDIATWLGLNSQSQHLPAIREVFGESFRPTELEKHVIGYQSPPNDFILDNMLVKEIPTIIARYSNRKPVMIFCATQKSAMKMARSLADLWLATAHQSRLWNPPHTTITAANSELQNLASAAVAFHHGSLDAGDRQAVEKGFVRGDINIICCTSTLAVGVNLPCYLVILKGTSCYTDTGLQEYSILEVMQMLGRAGRPQFETSACAVIMTGKNKVERYEKLLSGQDMLESSLHKNLIEHLNAEIGIGTISDVFSARRWLRSTFLHVRISRNPDYYKLESVTLQGSEDDILDFICKKELEELEAAELIKLTEAYDCTEYGRAMARYYVKFDTMKSLMAIPPNAKQSEILHSITQAIEFTELRWKTGEKGLYRKINKSNEIRYPIKVDIALPAHKASLLIQTTLGGYVPDKENGARLNLQLQQDARIVLLHANRLIRCAIDIQLTRQDATSALSALELGRSLAGKVWDDTPMQLKQIEGIGDVTARKLASHGIASIDDLSGSQTHRIELILGKNPPFGSNLLVKASRCPNLLVTAKEVGKRQIPTGGVELKIRCELGFLNENIPVYFNKKPVYICFLCQTGQGKLVDFRRFSASRLKQEKEFVITTHLETPTKKIICHTMCDEIAGTHRFAELKLGLPTSWFPSKIHLVDVDTSGSVSTHRVHTDPDQIFDALDLSDEDVLMAELDLVNQTEAAQNKDPRSLTEKRNLPNNRESKRKVSVSTDNDEHQQWREPTELPNGKWTCQHTCAEDNKVCKHQCCIDGVKKPRKRPKLETGTESTHKPTAALKKSSSKNTSSVLKKEARSIDEILRSLPSNGPQRSKSVLPASSSRTLADQYGNTKQPTKIEIDEIRLELSSDSLPDLEAILHSDTVPKAVTARAEKEMDDIKSCEDDFWESIDVDGCDWDMAGFNHKIDLQVKSPATELISGKDQTTTADISSQVSAKSPMFRTIQQTSGPVLETLPQSSYDQRRDAEHTSHAPSQDEKLSAIDEEVTNAGIHPHSNDMNPAAADHEEADHPQKDYKVYAHSPAEQARRQRERDEDQRKKWAEFEPWMYEQFASYVDIM